MSQSDRWAWLPWRRARASPARRPEPLPESPASGINAVAIAAALEAARSSIRIPNQRVSHDDARFASIISRFEDRFSGYPTDSAQRIKRVFRHLAQFDEDTAGSIRDMIVLANAGHALEFVGGSRAVKQAQGEIAAWSLDIYPEGAGADGLINNQLREPFIAGASSLEWFPTKNRKGVQGVAVVPAEEIRIARDPDTQHLQHWQTNTVEGEIKLNPLTYRYIAIQTDGRNPQGVPLLIASLEALERKGKLLTAEARVIEAMSTVALVAATVPKPTPEEVGLQSVKDPKYNEALRVYYRTVADLMTEGAERGFFLGPTGSEIKLTNISSSGEGAAEIIQGNNRRVWTGTRTLSFMRGFMDSTTEALAKVVYPILEAEAGNLQLIIGKQLEFGYNLHLRLRGIPATCYVRFEQADSPFTLDKAQTEKTRMETDQIGKQVFGKDWMPHAARRWDVTPGEDRNQVDDGALEELFNTPPSPAPQPAPGSRLVFDTRTRRYVRD